MSILQTWADAWGVTPAAMADLSARLSAAAPASAAPAGAGEAWAQAQIRLNAARAGARLWRNNVGAGLLESGSYVRWGLCNDSKQLNAQIKSADLIGITPIVVTAQHVGQRLGVFTSVEVKAPGWKPSPTCPHEAAQRAWAAVVLDLGGIARMGSI